MKKKHRKLLWIAGAGVGGLAAYQWLYKPWKLQRDIALAAAAGGATVPDGTMPALQFPGSLFPGPSTMVAPPQPGIIPSNLNPGAAVGGVVGACMIKKGNTWTQGQCETRLNAIVQGYKNSQAAIANLKSQTTNPAAAGIPAANLQLQQEIAARNAAASMAASTAASGDAQGAAIWQAAVDAHTQDISELQARIAAAGNANDNSAGIAAYEGAMAALDSNYFDLTGVHLTGL